MFLPYPTPLLENIAALADASPAQEIGGVITNREQLYVLPNACSSPGRGYIPSAELLTALIEDAETITYWHTHVGDSPPEFSPTDLNSINSANNPWLLYHQPSARWDFKDPSVKKPYLSRPWERAWTDCWTIVRDFYRWELGIQLPAHCHNGENRPWLTPGWNDFLERLPEHFEQVAIGEAVQQYDLVLFRSAGGRQPSHIGMLVSVGGTYQLLHHCYQRFSCLEPTIDFRVIDSFWRTKCSISQSNCSANWAIGMVGSTASTPIDLVRD